jgi:hypothetical protein
MQYALLIYNQVGDTDALTPEELEALSREYWALRDDPAVTGGAGLQTPETATTVRLRDGHPLVTDGPFADTKEYFAGFYLAEADDLDAAAEIAARIPALRFGGVVEIRPVLPGHS